MIKKIFFSATSVFFAFFLFVFLGMVVYADGASEDSEELVIEDGKYYQDYTSSIYYDEENTIYDYYDRGLYTKLHLDVEGAHNILEPELGNFTLTVYDDDPIVKIVPKELFLHECLEVYVGEKYGFFIQTVKNNKEDFYDYSSKVVLFSYKTELCNLNSTSSDMENVFSQRLEIVFSYHYHTLHKNTNKIKDNIRSYYHNEEYEISNFTNYDDVVVPIISVYDDNGKDGVTYRKGFVSNWHFLDAYFTNIQFSLGGIALDSLNEYDEEYDSKLDNNFCINGVFYDFYSSETKFNPNGLLDVCIRKVTDTVISNIPYIGDIYDFITFAVDAGKSIKDGFYEETYSIHNNIKYYGGANDQAFWNEKLVRFASVTTQENYKLCTNNSDTTIWDDKISAYANAYFLLDNLYNLSKKAEKGKLEFNPFALVSSVRFDVIIDDELYEPNFHSDLLCYNSLEDESELKATLTPTKIEEYKNTTIAVSRGQSKNMTFTPSHTGYYDFTLNENNVDLEINGIEKTNNGYYLTKGTKYDVVLPASLSRSGYMEIKPYLSYEVEIEKFNSNLNTSGYFNIPNGKAGQYVFDSSKIADVKVYDAYFNLVTPEFKGKFAVYCLNSGKYYIDVASNVTLNIHKMDEETTSNCLDLDSTFEFTGSIVKFTATNNLLAVSGYSIYNSNFSFISPYSINRDNDSYKLVINDEYYIVSNNAVSNESALKHTVYAYANHTDMNSNVELESGVIYGYEIPEGNFYGFSFEGLNGSQFTFADLGYSLAQNGRINHCNYYEKGTTVYFMLYKNAKPTVTNEVVRYEILNSNGNPVGKINGMYSFKRGGQYSVSLTNTELYDLKYIVLGSTQFTDSDFTVPADYAFGPTSLNIVVIPKNNNANVSLPSSDVLINAKESNVTYSLSVNDYTNSNTVTISLNSTGLGNNDVIYVTVQPRNCTSSNAVTLVYPNQKGLSSFTLNLVDLRNGTSMLSSLLENQSDFIIKEVKVETKVASGTHSDTESFGKNFSYNDTTNDKIIIDWFFGTTSGDQYSHHIYNERHLINMMYVLKYYPTYNYSYHHYILENNIYLNGFKTNSTLNNICFGANLRSCDDREKLISDLYFDEYPLFNQVDGTLYNITFRNCMNSTNNTINSNGLICNRVEERGTLTNVTILDSITVKENRATFGSIAGYNYGELKNCYAYNNIQANYTTSGYRYVGGIVGENNYYMDNCNYYGNINITSSNCYVYVGGIAGQLYGSKGIITNSNLRNPNISSRNNLNATGNAYVGGIVGTMLYSTNTSQKNSSYPLVTNCTIDGISLEGKYAGGITGTQYSGNISSCTVKEPRYNSSYVTGNYYAGGIAGLGYNVYNCSSAARVTGKDSYCYVGGICGNISSGSSVNGCTATGQVNNTYTSGFAGGIVGRSDSGTVKNNNFYSNVYGYEYVGGIVGYANGGSVTGNRSGSSSTDYNIKNTRTAGSITVYVGGLVGYSLNATVSSNYVIKMHVEGTIAKGKAFTGGLIGYAKGTTSESNKTAGYTVYVTGYGCVGGGYGLTVDSRINYNNININVSFGQIPTGSTVSDNSHKYKCNAGGLIGLSINTSMYSNTISGKLTQGTVSDYAWVGKLVGFAKGFTGKSNSVSSVTSNAKDVWSGWNHKVHCNQSTDGDNNAVIGEKIA